METTFENILSEKEIDLAIKEYSSLSANCLNKFGELKLVKNELDKIYESSPPGSSVSINATEGKDQAFYLEMKISNTNDHFYYHGEHDCLEEGFDDAVLSIKSQLRLWKGMRLNLYY